MTSHSWKCITCAQSYRSKTEPARTPKCPSCGQLLVPDLRAVPSPQPHAAGTRYRSATAANRPSSRPAGPEEAIALVSSSSAWVPDPEPGPSPSTPGIRNTSPRNRVASDRVTPDVAVASSDQTAGSRPNIRLWSAIGGLALVVIVGVIFMVNRSGPAVVAAKPPSVAAVASPAPTPAGASPTATVAAAPVISEPPVVAPPAVAHTVNLLKLIDPSRDTMTGNWKLTTGEFAPQLSSDAGQHARLNIPYQPPEEYDFRVDFTRTGGDNCMAQMFTHQNPCCLVLYGWKGTVSGFQQVKGVAADRNSTAVHELPTSNGQRHTSIIKVRKNAIEAWLDGNMIIRYDTNGDDLSAKDWKIDAPLGVGSQLSPTVFHTIEITEITGQGRALR
jgi:hypothetical protein